MNPISYELIGSALTFYQMRGFKYVEVPWVVSEEAMKVTLPPERTPMRCQDGPLVGSAEQSFIHMLLEGKLEAGRYVAATPCFRIEPVDRWHQHMFFKVELIVIDSKDAIAELVNHALDFFKAHGGGDGIHSFMTNEGVDIELSGVELGSYGVREYDGWLWTYGTGLAEPRFSMALARNAPT